MSNNLFNENLCIETKHNLKLKTGLPREIDLIIFRVISVLT